MKKKKEDLGLKFGTKEEKAWRDIRDRALTEIDRIRRELDINKAVVLLAKKKVKEEQKK